MTVNPIQLFSTFEAQSEAHGHFKTWTTVKLNLLLHTASVQDL